jgi:Mat/Ecp fimbriae major subunit
VKPFPLEEVVNGLGFVEVWIHSGQLKLSTGDYIMNMRIVKALVAVSAIALGSNAAFAATATANAKAEILAAITVTKTSDLDFGTIAVNNGGAVTINATTGAVTCGATAGDLVCGGTTSRAGFNITGADSKVVSINADASVTLTGPVPSGGGAAPTMTATLVESATTATLSTAAPAVGATPAVIGGQGSFKVGGTLSVGATQAAGAYSGPFTVEVLYQ